MRIRSLLLETSDHIKERKEKLNSGKRGLGNRSGRVTLHKEDGEAVHVAVADGSRLQVNLLNKPSFQSQFHLDHAGKERRSDTTHEGTITRTQTTGREEGVPNMAIRGSGL